MEISHLIPIYIKDHQSLAFVDLQNNDVHFMNQELNFNEALKEEVLLKFKPYSNTQWTSESVSAKIALAMDSLKRNIETAKKAN